MVRPISNLYCLEYFVGVLRNLKNRLLSVPRQLPPSPGAPKGNQNALKHGRYSAAWINERRQMAELVREVREVREIAAAVG